MSTTERPSGQAVGARRRDGARGIAARLGIVSLICALALLAGCSLGRMGPRMRLDRERLPDSVPELIEMSDRGVERSRSVAVLGLAAAAMEKALTLAPDDPDVVWRAARCFALLAENLDNNPDLALRMARHAEDFAHRAIDLAPDRPEGYYWTAAAAGLAALHQLAPGRAMQEAIEKPARHLVEAHPDFMEAGGLRILGALLVKAPSWPAGVGDVDEGTELLERAVKEHRENPLNHLFLAQAYAKVGRRREAMSAVRQVLAAPAEGEWRLIARPYRQEARQLLRDLSYR